MVARDFRGLVVKTIETTYGLFGVRTLVARIGWGGLPYPYVVTSARGDDLAYSWEAGGSQGQPATVSGALRAV